MLREPGSQPSSISLPEKFHKSHIKHSRSVAHHNYCHALHAILFILHVVLLVVMLWGHAERNLTITFDNSFLTVGLSAFLQAFYTLYTALLVCLTQKLALSDFLSRPHKITATHDVSGAWAGLGAAATTLWKQRNLAASTGATLMIFVYLLCVFVLHVASSTIMELEPYTAIATTDLPAISTFPNASIDLTSLETTTTNALVTLMSSLPGLSTNGLLNSTLYDTFDVTSQMINASVNAHTMRAHCGLLQNLSYTPDIVVVNTSVSGTGRISLKVDIRSLRLNEVSFVYEPENNMLIYMASTPMKINGSLGHNISVDFEATGQYPNTSMTVYIVACSLEVSNYTTSLEIYTGNLQPMLNQPDASSQPWSVFKSAFESQLETMVYWAYLSTNCTGICYGNGTLDDYLMTLLGTRQSNGTASSITLTPYQFENALSTMATQLIWIIGQVAEADGGSVLTKSFTRVTEQVLRWRLNINTTPVIFALSASFIIFLTAFLMLGVPLNIKKDPPPVKGTTVLEMLWAGAHFSVLHKRLNGISCPSSRDLRSTGMFEVCLTRSELAKEESTEALPLLNPESGTGSGFEAGIHGIVRFPRIWSLMAYDGRGIMAGTRISEAWQTMRRSSRVVQLLESQHVWCYLLHGLFVLLHVVLLLLLMGHPEHHVNIQSVGEVFTTVLAASLQFFYVAYTLILVFITQRLAVSRAMSRTQNLTIIHDLSQSWTGIGSALVGIWKQISVMASLRTTLVIATYYLCVSILHITSTTVMQFEVFNSSASHTAQSTLAWPTSGLGTYNWGALSPIVPLSQLPSLSTRGLINSTVYDIPLVGSMSLNATVNATTVGANCGLVPLLPSDGFFNITVPTLGAVVPSPFYGFLDNAIQFLPPSNLRNASNMSSTCSGCGEYLIYFVTASLDLDTSSDIAANLSMTWALGDDEAYNGTAYVVACSLNVTTRVDVLDVQNYVLTRTGLPQSEDDRTWSVWSPVGNMPALTTKISNALNMNPVSKVSNAAASESDTFSNIDLYTMSLFGLNVTTNGVVPLAASSTNAFATISLSQFEDAISQIAAQYVWAAGHTNGSFGPAYGFGESVVTDLVTSRRLNVNTIPVMIASAASLVLFILATYMVSVGPSAPMALSELGVLQTLWLEAHSDIIRARMREVADPTEHNLRVAGMFGVCLADEVRKALEGEVDTTSALLNE